MNMKMDKKWQNALVCGALFFVVAHPMTYALVQRAMDSLSSVASVTSVSQSMSASMSSVTGPLSVMNEAGPTTFGVLVHAVVFAVVVRRLMDLQ